MKNRSSQKQSKCHLSDGSLRVFNKSSQNPLCRLFRRAIRKHCTLKYVVLFYCSTLIVILIKSHQKLHRRLLNTATSTPIQFPEPPILLASLSRQHDQRDFAPLFLLRPASLDPDYNDMTVSRHSSQHFQRSIGALDDGKYASARNQELHGMDYAPDGLDDYYLNDEDVEPTESCRRNSWRTKQFPNCNNLHELTLHRDVHSIVQDYNISYKGSGSFRITWLFERHDLDEEFIIKPLRYHGAVSVFGHKRFYDMHQEAIIMERLTASPRIVDIYGFCGATIMAEHMHDEITPLIVPGAGVEWLNAGGYMDQTKLDELQRDGDVHPMNSETLSLERKLDLAIVMAESIAEIHGFVEGSIVHGDIHPVQWLLDKHGNLKLNDFNNGDVQLFDANNNDYCPMYRCYGGPQFRPPEEIRCSFADESIDTYAMGMTIYTLLIGLWPYYQYGKRQDKLIKKKLLQEGELPFVDPRYRNHSLVEGGLVQIMDSCWRAPKKRLSIFTVVKKLYKLRGAYHNAQQ